MKRALTIWMKAQNVLANSNATPEQKADAKEAVDVMAALLDHYKQSKPKSDGNG